MWSRKGRRRCKIKGKRGLPSFYDMGRISGKEKKIKLTRAFFRGGGEGDMRYQTLENQEGARKKEGGGDKGGEIWYLLGGAWGGNSWISGPR